MDKKKGFGNDFEKAFREGMVNNDWSHLNDVIVMSVDNFLDDVGDRMNASLGNRGSSAVPLSKRKKDISGDTQTARYQRQLHSERQQVRERMERERREREEAKRQRQLARRKPPGGFMPPYPYTNVAEGSSIVNSVIGGIGMGFTGVATLIGAVTGMMAGGLSAGLIFTSVGFLAFSALLARGVRQQKMSALAARYVQAIGQKNYVEVSNLALYFGISERKVVRQINSLLKLGYFPQGHLDRGCRTFCLTDEVFNHYIELESSSGAQAVIDTTARDANEQEFPSLSPEESAELSRMIRDGEDYIRKFGSLNANIPGVEISAKLDRLEGLLKEIFSRVREHPEQMKRIHELMDYYLPTAEKLVDAYREYDRVSEPGREIIEAKRDIENTLDTINSALGKLLNKLFKDSVLDVTTDAQVLKTVLSQKGLS